MVNGNQGTTLLDAARIATWATPRAEDGESSGMRHARGTADTLTAQSSLASPWATPSSRDWKDSPGMATTGTDPDGTERSRLDQLPRQANLMIASPWATPDSGGFGIGDSRWQERREEVKAKGINGNGFGMTIGMAASLAQPTDSGATQSGSPAGTVKPGQLNPGLPRWLMGLPIVWDLCAMQIERTSRRSSKKASTESGA